MIFVGEADDDRTGVLPASRSRAGFLQGGVQGVPEELDSNAEIPRTKSEREGEGFEGQIYLISVVENVESQGPRAGRSTK